MRGSIKCIILISIMVWYTCAVEIQFCKRSNPFLQEITKDVKTNTQVSFSDVNNKCGYEWKSHGTCCEYSSLVDFVKKDIDSIHAYIQSTLQTKYTYRELMEKVTNLYKMLPVEESSKPELANIISKLVNAYEKTESLVNKSAFKDNMNKCWLRMITIRSSSVCSICSGRNRQFFNENKVLVDEETCSSAMTHCVDYFEDSLSLITYLRDFMVQFGRVSFSISINNHSYLIILRHLSRILENDVHLMIDEYFKRTKRGEKQLKEIERMLCYSLLRIQKEPFIGFMKRNLSFFYMTLFAASGTLRKNIKDKELKVQVNDEKISLDMLESYNKRERLVKIIKLAFTRSLRILQPQNNFDKSITSLSKDLIADAQVYIKYPKTSWTHISHIDVSVTYFARDNDNKLPIPIPNGWIFP